MWRGGLPPLGCGAAQNLQSGFVRQTAFAGFTTASRSNGGKSPHHNAVLLNFIGYETTRDTLGNTTLNVVPSVSLELTSIVP